MTSSNVVSVIVPAFNAARTLAATLDCLRRQTHAQFEALVIDDRSLDGTGAVIEEYAALDSRIRHFRGPGQGVSAARNVGIAAARGQWLYFLDADDWVEPSFLRQMLDPLEAGVADVTFCAHRRVMPSGQMTPPYDEPAMAHAPFETFARRCPVAIHCVLMRTENVRALGGFDVSLRTCEDWDLWLRLSRAGAVWVHVPTAVAYYRAVPGSLSSKALQMAKDAETVLRRAFAKGPASDSGRDQLDQYPNGADPAMSTLEWAIDNYRLWMLICDSSRRFSSGELPLPEHVDFDAHWLPVSLLSAVCVGLAAAPEELASRWAEFGPRLSDAFRRVGVQCKDASGALRMLYRFESLVLDYDDLRAPRRLARTIGLRVNLRDPARVEVPEGIDRLYVYFCADDEVLGLATFGVLGEPQPEDWRRLAHELCGVRVPDRRLRAILSARVRDRQRDVVRRMVATGKRLRGYSKGVSRMFRAPDDRSAARTSRKLHKAMLEELSHQSVAEILARGGPASLPRASEPTAGVDEPRTQSAAQKDRRAVWEAVFERQDPWDYSSAYETEKYERQLALLHDGGRQRSPDEARLRVLELGCAEGMFTLRLAPSVGHVIAADISSRALARAKARCGAFDHVEYVQLDMVTDDIPGPVDAIVCSETLYYAESVPALEQIASKLVAALRPGGVLVCAHANSVTDNPQQTGFELPQPFGAFTIGNVLAKTAGLSLERSIHTELYRVERYVRAAERAQRVEPVVEHLPIGAPVSPRIAREVVWGGAVTRRVDVNSVRSTQVPVLMYHRVAEDGPEQLARYRMTPAQFEDQMRWLRQNGFHALVSSELEWFISKQEPFYGRPVMITFDDGYQDFADFAWPILTKYGFRAEVFLVTDLVGQSSVWDRRFGRPAPLMSAQTVIELAQQGVAFGSHLATHPYAEGLTTQQLASELLRSRMAVQRWVGSEITSLATPYGCTDQRVRRLAAECGYRTAFSTEDGYAALGANMLHLPRIEAYGGQSLFEFQRRVRGTRSASLSG